jgi:hypothetical protein
MVRSKNSTQWAEVAGTAGGNFFSVKKKAADGVIGRRGIADLL